MAPSLGIALVFTPIENDPANVERAIAAFAHDLLKGGPGRAGGQHDQCPSRSDRLTHGSVSLAGGLLAPFLVAAGGLMSYGVDWVHEFGQVAFYVDRILRGATPAEFPVQAATKFETALNLKTAKALGLTVPDRPARSRRRGDRMSFHGRVRTRMDETG